jgi:hypothetical protein
MPKYVGPSSYLDEEVLTRSQLRLMIGVTPQEFGATVDGVTNNQSSFQAAATAIKNQGSGTLRIPGKNAIGAPKKYIINGNVSVQHNMRIISDGAILEKTTASPYTFFVGSTNGQTGYGSGPSNVYVNGITFKGSFNPAAPIVACAFGLHHSQNWLVEHCTFLEMQGPGHIFDLGGCDGITIRKSKFIGYYIMPDWTHSERSEAIQIDSSYNGATSTQDTSGFDGLLTRNVTVEDCEFLPLTNQYGTFPCPNPIGSHSIREDLKYEYVTFKNNLVVDGAEQIEARGSNKNGTGLIKFGIIDYLIIEGNKFLNTTTRVLPVIMVQGWTTGNLNAADPNVNPTSPTGTFATPNISAAPKILFNQFIGFKPPEGQTAPQPLIILQGTGLDAEVEDAVIAFNTFRDCYGGTTSAGESVIYAARCKHLRIFGNVFNKVWSIIYINNCVDTIITGNSLTDSYSYPLYSSASTGTVYNSNTHAKYRKPVQFDANSRTINVQANNWREPMSATLTDNTCVVISGSKDFLVTGNTATNLSGTTMPRAFLVANGASDGKCKNNQVTGFTAEVVTSGAALVNVRLGDSVLFDDLPAGVTLTLAKPSGGAWPGVPTVRTDLIIQWKGADPSPPVVASRTLGSAGMLDNVDLRIVV